MRLIRAASPIEADKLACLLVRSITELCQADHHNDPALLDTWCRNKTPENMAAWVEDPGLYFVVMLSDAERAGVGLVHKRGEILLNYVSPDFRFQGISRAILDAMEKYLLSNGKNEGHLVSTTTAHDFYVQAGWQDAGDPIETNGIIGWPMQKELSWD